MRARTLLLFAVAGALHGAALGPSPKLTPRDVVEAQLAALGANDEPRPDAGIRTAFRFASPDNKRATGPIERFIQMVKNPHYAPLLNHRAAHLSETTEKDNLARIKVTVIASDGEEAAFVWILERVWTQECGRCWMTSTVMRVGSRQSPFNVARLRDDTAGVAVAERHRHAEAHAAEQVEEVRATTQAHAAPPGDQSGPVSSAR